MQPPPAMFHTVIGPNPPGVHPQPTPEIIQAFQQMAQQFPMNITSTVPPVRAQPTESTTASVPPSVNTTVDISSGTLAESSADTSASNVAEGTTDGALSTEAASRAAPAPFVAAGGWSFPTASNEAETENTEVSGSQPNGSAHATGDDQSHAAHQPTVEDAD